MKKKTSPRVIRSEEPPEMTGRDGYRKAEPHLRRDFDYRCAYCMVHEQQVGGTEAFCIDHFKPRSKGGEVNNYSNLYWACIPCNMFKHDKWPTAEQEKKGYRFADPCREKDYGVHFVESDSAELLPQTPCGEYHVLSLRLNRAWLCQLRVERKRKQERLSEAFALQEELEQEIISREDEEAEVKLRLLSFLREEISALQRELTVSIPFIASQDELHRDEHQQDE